MFVVMGDIFDFFGISLELSFVMGVVVEDRVLDYFDG